WDRLGCGVTFASGGGWPGVGDWGYEPRGGRVAMRRWWVVLVGVLAVVVAGLAVPTAAGAAAQHGGDRIMVASATFADPADWGLLHG
ncbi:MAG: hypothetical protein MUF33_15815, partial [Candidatus Nanopelagicales bacterium]|nr:hypothetical protein [Candidatus Nanopelagicales bacterium]